MKEFLSNRVKTLKPSSTLAITAKAKEMKAQGIDVIGLGAGEPDFNTPQNIINAAIDSMQKGYTKYTPSGGLPALKDAIIEKFKRDNQLEYKQNEVIVGVGAKHVLYTLFQVILNDGDEVIIPTPYWVSYPEQVKLAGGVPVFVETTSEQNYKMTAEQLRNAITDKTKAVIINSPSNPTGMIYHREELEEIAKVALEHNILIVSDEIYEKLVYNGAEHFSIAQISEEVKSKTIVINGVSKSHSMTGWRIGYAAGDADIIKAMTDLASHSTSNPTTASQYAAIEAYNGPQDSVEEMRKAFESRLETIYPKLSAIPGFKVVKPQGAFYLLPDVGEAAAKTGFATVDEFAGALLTEANVAVIPGSGFGAPSTIRISYATSLDLLEEAVRRIEKFVKDHWKN
ncbi:pyridoxal phosphate-dependent aminotransferase [Ureibacillus terrenus]|uniref:Aminotransferase n=1 Tax=Ureibacillus terrenus TaxID=118246 RepID=A0A540V6F7_9BACL|nr:pyridoxal phosphate-dependent aminotransferase [Ureibacillus terrenus]MED3660658.1 pyridoxal phosphate-dependent aminotransferase [Ureibacillus terrenus]MED3762778.1 pyridoxal phosphate-dependent aminotransferase [Ureibacillus terrenus]TQE92350.1 pyridoxal phosphate-dependent aminotransferase [Ureibacillus terrenus]